MRLIEPDARGTRSNASALADWTLVHADGVVLALAGPRISVECGRDGATMMSGSEAECRQLIAGLGLQAPEVRAEVARVAALAAEPIPATRRAEAARLDGAEARS